MGLKRTCDHKDCSVEVVVGGPDRNKALHGWMKIKFFLRDLAIFAWICPNHSKSGCVSLDDIKEAAKLN